MLRFDVAAALPPGAIVTRVELRLVLTPSNPPPIQIGLHRVLAAWGEGDSAASGGSGAPSAPGDATWLHTFYDDTFWTHPGGDFVAEASATQRSGRSQAPSAWGSTPDAVADVQAWLDFPETNHGWLLIGGENAPTTSKRFASREADDPASHPQLVVEYELPCAMLALPAAAHALCHAYCDALACEAPAPAASPRACARIAALYASRSGGAMLLCKRPKSEPYLLEDEMRIAPPEASEGAGG